MTSALCLLGLNFCLRKNHLHNAFTSTSYFRSFLSQLNIFDTLHIQHLCYEFDYALLAVAVKKASLPN